MSQVTTSAPEEIKNIIAINSYNYSLQRQLVPLPWIWQGSTCLPTKSLAAQEQSTFFL